MMTKGIGRNTENWGPDGVTLAAELGREFPVVDGIYDCGQTVGYLLLRLRRGSIWRMR